MRIKKAELATSEDLRATNIITNKKEAVAIVEGCGISKWYTDLIIKKINENNVVVAVTEHTTLVGFFYNAVLRDGEIMNACKVYRISKP